MGIAKLLGRKGETPIVDVFKQIVDTTVDDEYPKKQGDYIITRAHPKVATFLAPLIEGTNGIIAGGLFKDFMRKREIAPEIVKDIDTFYMNDDDYLSAVNKFKRKLGKPVYDNEHATCYANGRFMIDLVKKNHAGPEAIIASFDFTVTKMAFYQENDEYLIIRHKDFYKDVKGKTLRYGADHDAWEHNNAIERIVRYGKYGFKLSNDTLNTLVLNKIETIPELQGVSVESVISAGKKGESSVDPMTTLELLISHAEFEQSRYPEASGSSTTHRSMEKNYERSIVQMVKYGVETGQMHKIAQRAEKALGIEIIDNTDYLFSYRVYTSMFLAKLTDLVSSGLTQSDAMVLLNAVLGITGFISTNKYHWLVCEDKNAEVPLTHGVDCLPSLHHDSWSGSDANERRENEAEVMVRILSGSDVSDRNVNSASTITGKIDTVGTDDFGDIFDDMVNDGAGSSSVDWASKVAGYFRDLYSDALRTEFMGFFEWDAALRDGVFNIEMPYGIMFEMVRES